MDIAVTADCANKPSFIDDATAGSDLAIDQLVAAFVRMRGIDRLEGAMMTRCWLAADMGVPATSLDGLLKLMRWQGLIGLPDDHFITVEDAEAMRAIARCLPVAAGRRVEARAEDLIYSLPIAEGSSAWH